MTNNTGRNACATVLLAVLTAWSAEPVRERRNFDDGWRFYKGDASGGERAAFDDSAWRKVRLPHDWSIEGPYSGSNPSGNGYLPGGIGWYRKGFPAPETLRGRKVSIEFDGVYRDSDVWINGHHLGHRPYGYSSFAYDLTPFLNFGARQNVLAVRVDHSVVADHIDVNSVPGRQGLNDFGKTKYGGPCPPSGTHRYFFKLYALDTKLNLTEGIGKSGLEDAMQGHILAQAELVGVYQKR